MASELFKKIISYEAVDRWAEPFGDHSLLSSALGRSECQLEREKLMGQFPMVTLALGYCSLYHHPIGPAQVFNVLPL